MIRYQKYQSKRKDSTNGNTARDNGLAHAVAFKFVRYGVFVAYGVGNGYIRQNGRVVRGSVARQSQPLRFLSFRLLFLLRSLCLLS